MEGQTNTDRYPASRGYTGKAKGLQAQRTISPLAGVGVQILQYREA